MTADITRQRSILRQVLLRNLGLFGGLGITGWMAGSSALLANALDNGLDAAVYLVRYVRNKMPGAARLTALAR
jgi:divalent metal cation (Fe/Co/Zn/Cd) transporter